VLMIRLRISHLSEFVSHAQRGIIIQVNHYFISLDSLDDTEGVGGLADVRSASDFILSKLIPPYSDMMTRLRFRTTTLISFYSKFCRSLRKTWNGILMPFSYIWNPYSHRARSARPEDLNRSDH
jgi:hypothetical protein